MEEKYINPFLFDGKGRDSIWKIRQMGMRSFNWGSRGIIFDGFQQIIINDTIFVNKKEKQL